MRLGRLIAIGIILALIALILFVVVAVVFDTILMGAISSAPGLAWLDGWSGLLIVMCVWLILPDRYKAVPIHYDIRGSALIDASAEAIWALMRPAPGQTYYLSSASYVTGIVDQPDRVNIHFDQKMSDTPLPTLEAVIEEEEPRAYLRMSYLNADAFPLWSKDLVATEYFMQAEGDKWRVTNIEHLDKLRFTTVLALLFLNPCRDGVQRLKALSEGREDMSWMGRMTRGISADGQPSPEMSQTARVVGFTACVVLTVFTVGLVWFIANLAAP